MNGEPTGFFLLTKWSRVLSRDSSAESPAFSPDQVSGCVCWVFLNLFLNLSQEVTNSYVSRKSYFLLSDHIVRGAPGAKGRQLRGAVECPAIRDMAALGQGETVFRGLLPINLTLYLWSEKVAPVTRKDL